MVKNIDSAVLKSSLPKRRASQMEQHEEQRRIQREWQRKQEHNVPCLSSLYSDHSQNDDFWHQYSYPDTSDPPPPRYMGPAILPRPTEPPRTPPAYASVRRLYVGSQEPISPPNPLRLASTTASQALPRPEMSPFFWPRSPPQQQWFERVGHPSLRVFRVKLPRNLRNETLDAIVEAAEAHVDSLPNGWRTDLYSLTKCDIACKDISGISKQIKQLSKYVSRAIQILYGYRKIVFDHNQPHILKYSAKDCHTGVELHCDRCDITANLSLSKRDTFAGGGTYIAAMHKVVKLEQGEFLLHPGCLVHGGNPITAGTRYLLVTFANFER